MDFEQKFVISIASIFMFLVILTIIYIYWRLKGRIREPNPVEEDLLTTYTEVSTRRSQFNRSRGARLRANALRQHANETPVEEVQNEEKGEIVDSKLGTKKRAKLEAKMEKKAQREVEETLRQEKKKKLDQEEEERRKAEKKEKEEEKRKEEAEKTAKAEQERKEHEEYLKMKEAFAVEEEGNAADEVESENALQEFVNYIKTNKVVVIEDLASHFKLKTQAVIDRIKDMQKDDIITGVIDDRGKFIYVSSEEMEAVVKFIKQRGRISLAELAENSNNLINMMPVTAVK